MTPNASDPHRAWLELVDTEGPFLAIPPLKRVWPQGMPSLPDDRKAVLGDARKDFEAAWENLDRTPDSEAVVASYRVVRDKWVETILREVAGWAESLSWGEVAGIAAHSPNHAVTIRAQASLNGPDGIGAIVHIVDPVNSLRQTPSDLWAANPVDRVEVMLRENKIPIGIVTDGRWWGLVCAHEGTMAASGVVDAMTWVEEPRTRDAFLALIGRQYLVGGDPAERLPVLFEESVAAAEEITEALGAQVRRAVELLIQSFSESAADARRRGLPGPLPDRTHDSYEAAVTVMMRVVFLLFAEERGLLPSGELFEQGYGVARELDRLVARETEESEEALDSTSLTWHRLLATSVALHGGASFESLRMPPYGGSLFDPARFRFLTTRNEQGTLALTVSDRVMLHVLRSVQVADIKGEARRISFRDIDVEQIGYIYEGLLGYTATIASEATVGLRGTLGEEPEIPVATLEALAVEHADRKMLAAAIRTFVEEDQPSAKPPSTAAIAKALDAAVDPSVIGALTQALGDDPGLRDRVKPWLGLIRLDLRKRPFVVPGGGLIVKETPSRKNAGAHYTPKSLAEEVVLHTLQPLCYSPGPHQTAREEEWNLKSSDELLDLKVADIACGSGAFLVAAGRYLAERVVEAWTAEDPSYAPRRDLSTRAIRQVVANCLYGADINDMAVEMCKLSLWLVSLDRDLPFSFVDDKIFLGNSLLGLTSLEQLRRLHIDPSRISSQQVIDIFDVDIDAIIRRAVGLREHLATEIDETDPARTSSAKHRQLRRLREATAELRRLADAVVAAGLPLGGKPGRALDEAYENLRIAVRAAHPDNGKPGDQSFLDSIVDAGLTPTVATDYDRWLPLHWVVEAPDVFVERGGFDALVGNPPFVAGGQVSDAMGLGMRAWLVNQVAGGTLGAADLAAYFARRYSQLGNSGSTIGFIATNTLAQGDTREVGLDQLNASGWEITRGIRSMDWPTSSASVACSLAWLTNRAVNVADAAPRWCDGVLTKRISSMLEPEGRVTGMPARLKENQKIAFKGSNVYGSGFVLSREEAKSMLAEDPRNHDVIFDFPDGKLDINGKPGQEAGRCAINFRRWPREKAAEYTTPFARVEELVKPERMTNTRPARRDRWWQYGDYAGGLEDAAGDLEQVIVMVIVSKTLMPCLLPARQVFNHGLCVFATDSRSHLAVLSSSIHQAWAIKYGSGMRNDPRYTPSDVFETFPRPAATDSLRSVGQVLDEERREIMLRRGLGLTRLYNRVNDPTLPSASDPDVARMREIHVELDRTVLDTYGWSDIVLDHGFFEYRQMLRWTVSPAARIEMLDRLLEENHKRVAAEGARTGKKVAHSMNQSHDSQLDLFGGD